MKTGRLTRAVSGAPEAHQIKKTKLAEVTEVSAQIDDRAFVQTKDLCRAPINPRCCEPVTDSLRHPAYN
jgi:hypothetical protein